MAPLGVALIGGGIFAKQEHMPAIMQCDSLSLKAIYSRSLKSAQGTAALYTKGGAGPDLYSADSGDSARDYADLLLRADVHAVIIALPIVSQPEFIRAALAADKHVLAEKPLAPDVKTGRELIEYYRRVSREGKVTLSIAENFRFVPSFAYAAAEARKLGRLQHFSVRSFHLMGSDTKWYGTEWRRKPEYQGGFLLDGGVHQAAATRLLLGSEARPASVRAVTSQVQPHLAPIDTVSAIVETAEGASGTFQLSCGSRLNAFEWALGLEGGSVTVQGETVTVVRGGDDGATTVREFERTSGVAAEVAAWAAGLVRGEPDGLQAPEQALADLEFLEKMFVSGEQDGAAQKYELQL
ncbi:hypothetical protein B0J13DRAFT_160271 [Dactylonectria estremocensis]|uniref:Gfo/Idh/MocA-like oxidoreductase N-terminal domain-containing protein n=1 Tax=Dactylonectria estremocensis TaxID=1079267 RepID=A0A9P9DMB3_9HYPO|nr:hypothetical protein B0J13DRAFT_160271 [Dactylonectria estremocensis]